MKTVVAVLAVIAVVALANHVSKKRRETAEAVWQDSKDIFAEPAGA